MAGKTGFTIRFAGNLEQLYLKVLVNQVQFM